MAPRQLKCTQQQSGRTVIHFSTRQQWRLNSLLQFGFSDSTSSKTGHPKSPTSHSHLTTGKLSATNPRPPHLNFEILNSLQICASKLYQFMPFFQLSNVVLFPYRKINIKIQIKIHIFAILLV